MSTLDGSHKDKIDSDVNMSDTQQTTAKNVFWKKILCPYDFKIGKHNSKEKNDNFTTSIHY